MPSHWQVIVTYRPAKQFHYPMQLRKLIEGAF